MKRMKRLAAFLLLAVMLANTIPFYAFAAGEEMTLTVSTVSGTPGEEVKVTVDVSDNPGIASLVFDVNYDSMLTLVDVQFSEAFGNLVTTPTPYTNPQTITLISPFADTSANGTLATLTFAISESAADEYEADVSITCKDNEIVNANKELVPTKAVNGKVCVFRGIPGDVNGDKAVNTKDAVLLFRYVAGWDVTVDPLAVDCNGDGVVDTWDAIELFRYTADWPDIELHYGTVCVHTLTHIERMEATCVDAGNAEYWHCANCNLNFADENGITAIEDVVVAAKGHDYFDGVCTVCGATDPTYGSEGLKYTLSSDGNSYTLSGIGTCTDTDIVVPQMYNDLPITAVANYAFSSKKNITSITLPNTVTAIGNNAFASCEKMTTVKLSDGLLSIGSSAFSGCSQLVNITIPTTVTNIDEKAFKSCSSLNSIKIPDGVTVIAKSSFQYCKSLTSLTIPSGVTGIAAFAFQGCTSLTSVTLPSSVTIIGAYAFKDCENISKVYISDIASWCQIQFVDYLANPMCPGKAALYLNGTLVTDLVIPSGVTSIRDEAFRGCSSLASVTISSSVTSIGEAAFNSSSLTNITIPSSVTSIGSGAFAGSNLVSAIIPSSVTSMGYAFSSCTTLTSVTILDGVTRIGEQTFNNCTALKNIYIPKSVTDILYGAFKGCSALTDVYYEGSMSEWSNKLTIVIENDFLTNANIHYNAEME